jgi:hypothetical protein
MIFKFNENKKEMLTGLICLYLMCCAAVMCGYNGKKE